jgi:hypothetical protein
MHVCLYYLFYYAPLGEDWPLTVEEHLLMVFGLAAMHTGSWSLVLCYPFSSFAFRLHTPLYIATLMTTLYTLC